MNPTATIGRRGRTALGILDAMFVIAIVALVSWMVAPAPHPQFAVTTCLTDAGGLRRDATVRIAGVDVGRVETVRAQPEDPNCPALVEMAITAKYQLKIPNDSVVSIGTDGLLGNPYPEIDASHATGPAIESGGRLPSRVQKQMNLTDAVQALQVMVESDKARKSLLNKEKGLDSQPSEKLPEEGNRPNPKAGK